MLGMTLTVCRMFIDASLGPPSPTPDPKYTNAVVIEGSGMDLINAPNSICVEDNSNIHVVYLNHLNIKRIVISQLKMCLSYSWMLDVWQ